MSQHGKALYEEEIRAELLRSMLENDWLSPSRVVQSNRRSVLEVSDEFVGGKPAWHPLH